MWAGRRLWQKELKRKNMLLLYIFLTLLIMAWFGCGPNTRQIRSCIFWQSFESLWSFLESFRVLLACCNSIQNAGYTPIPHPKRNTFSLWLNIWNEEINLSQKLNMNNYIQDQLALPVFPLGPVFCFSCPNSCLPCYMWAASWSPLYNISLPRSERHLCNATATAGIRHICPL